MLTSKIEKTSLPKHSILYPDLVSANYSDTYSGQIDKPIESSLILAKTFLNAAPNWVEKLMNLRNVIVRFLGLKTNLNQSKREHILQNFKGELGEQIGFFKVFGKNENEIILGEDDRHLNFRVSLLKVNSAENRTQIFVSTIVKFHNVWGKIYFLPVKPFHQLIVSAMLRSMLKQLSESKT
jgi:hypothetical protein